jgi:hypothetical protein
MKNLHRVFALTAILFSCSEQESEKEKFIKHVQTKIGHIDANRRIRIVEDDFHKGDSIYKIRGYFMDDVLQKLIAIMHTNDFERDDYFYFENHHPLFSGHVVVSKSDRKAEEYKYYYENDGFVKYALYWSDTYRKGEQFPHEHFIDYDHDRDSIRQTDEERLQFFLSLLDLEGIEIKHLNENLEANTMK